MEKIEIILDNYSQETKNAVLVAALKSENSTLVELILMLKPDIGAGGQELFKYAIRECNFELLGMISWETEIGDNQEALKEGIRIAVSLTRIEKYEVLSYLIQNIECANVAVEEMLKQDNPSIDAIIDLLKLGAIAHFWPMHLDKHQLIAEKLFKYGFGKSVKFSNVALEQFCLTICKNNKQGVVKKLIKDYPDLVSKLVEIAIKCGYTSIVKVLHQENALMAIDDKSFEKAIREKHYFTVKYLAENGIRNIVYTDVVVAAAYGSVKMMNLLIEQMGKQGKVLTAEQYAKIIRYACIQERIDCVKELLKAGHQCDFDANIKSAVVNEDIKMLELLMKYATKLSESKFSEAMTATVMNNHPELVCIMSSYADKHPEKFN